VANAGVLTIATWDRTTLDDWRTVVDVNLIGVWNTCAAAIPIYWIKGRQPGEHQLCGCP